MYLHLGVPVSRYLFRVVLTDYPLRASEVSLQSVIADLSYCWLSDFYG